MAYITVSNSKKIIRKLDEAKLDSITEKLYKWDIYFFSKRESAILKGIRELLRDPSNFVIHYYNPIEVVDSFHYVYPESQPAYHKDNSCERLKSNFTNIEVPVAIREKGKEEVTKYRDWFLNTTFKADDPKDYIYKLQQRFPYVGEINPRAIDYSNSGSLEKKNYSLNELEDEIDSLLRAAGEYFKYNTDLQPILRRYQKWTFLAYVYGDLYNNESGLSDDELKSFLRNYDITFKKPVKYLLEEYYRVKFNPDMSFESSILTQLGFKACGHCMSVHNEIVPSPAIVETIETNDDLPY